MEEIWKDIEGYEGLYQVSNFGRVKSLERLVERPDGRNRLAKEKIMSLRCEWTGYLAVTLQKEGFRKTLKVHRLVAFAFIPNTNEKKEVNHINGIKYDNRVENLEWCSKEENQQHAIKMGLRNDKGQHSVNSKLTDDQVRSIKKELKTSKGVDLAKKYDVSFQLISRIKIGKAWKHI